MHITLRAGEKLYLNGAVLRVDRKVSLELMNEASFLLEAHVMSVEKATTPLRQLYFIVQTMLMDPSDTTIAAKLFGENIERMLVIYTEAAILEALVRTRELVEANRYFDALKILRAKFSSDDALMASEALKLAS